jgi:putative membrane protein
LRLVYWAVIVIAACLLVPFAVSNRLTVSLGLWPLPFFIDLPLYLLVLTVLLMGFVIGAATGWIGGCPARRELRRRSRRIKALESELKSARSELEGHLPKGRSEVPV